MALTPSTGAKEIKVLETTAGRVIFNQIWPSELGFYNKVCGKKQLSDIIWRCYKAVRPGSAPSKPSTA